MNPIENVWGRMGQILKRDYKHPADSDQLFATLEEIWVDAVGDANYRRKLIDSMNNRISVLRDVSGGYTKY